MVVGTEVQAVAAPATNSLFQESWWLDAVAPGAWTEARAETRGGSASLRYVVREADGRVVSEMPELTQTLGPCLHLTQSKYAERLSSEHRLLGALADRLVELDWFCQSFHRSIGNWLPFAWRGFEATLRYTYVLEPLDDVERLWSELRAATRTQVRKAARRLEVTDELGVADFVALHLATFHRQDSAPPWSLETVHAVVSAALGRGQGRLTFAVDRAGRAHAAVFVVWDERATYYLLGGGEPALRESAAMSLLLWDAVCHAAGRSATFDFEGTMLERVEPFFRGFGARQRPYLRVWRASERLRGR